MFEGIRHVMDRDPHLGEYFLTDAFQYMIDRGARLHTAEVGGWFDCGKPETLLETNRVMLERGHGGDPDLPASVTVEGAIAVAGDAIVETSTVGPNVRHRPQGAVSGVRASDTRSSVRTASSKTAISWIPWSGTA